MDFCQAGVLLHVHLRDVYFLLITPIDDFIYFCCQIIERFNWRLPGYVGTGNDKFSFSHVDDVVKGHIAAMNKGQPGERYLLTGENASFRHVFDIAAIITETKKPMFHIPFWTIEAYGWVSVMFSRITGKLPLMSPPVCSVFEVAF
jgi:farnesol dehydrogenase